MPSKLHFCVMSYTALLRLWASGGQGPRIHVLTRIENYIFSVMAYLAILRFRASGSQEPITHALTRSRKLQFFFYGLPDDSPIPGLWWPGAEYPCFDAPSKTSDFLSLLIRRLFDFVHLVARGPEFMF